MGTAIYDYVAEKYMTDREGMVWKRGRYLYCSGKRQLSRRELRRHNLINENLIFAGAQSSVQFVRGLKIGLLCWRFRSLINFGKGMIWRAEDRGLSNLMVGGSIPPSCVHE